MTREPDIKRLARSLLDSEARLRSVLASSLDPLVTIDVGGTIVSVSESVQRVFGYEPRELVGQNVTMIMPETYREHHVRALQRYRSTGFSRVLGQIRELEVLCKDGSVITCELAFSRADMPDASEPLITGSFRDITRRKQAELKLAAYRNRLRALASELVIAEERERRQLAVDLHDGLMQTIALAKIRLSALRGSPGVELEAPLGEIERLVDEACDAAKGLTFQLSPTILYDLGLSPALEWLSEDIQRQYGLRVTLEDEWPGTSLDQHSGILIFRAVRELLINVAKHADVDRAAVRLRPDGGNLRITVEDEGIGFDPSAVNSTHFGLFSIRERLRHLGGGMEIRSTQGRGTKVLISAPIAPRAPDHGGSGTDGPTG